VIAGYNYAQGNTSNPTQSSSAPADTELGKTFPSSSDAVIWATEQYQSQFQHRVYILETYHKRLAMLFAIPKMAKSQ
jgi:hypothetical protein